MNLRSVILLVALQSLFSCNSVHKDDNSNNPKTETIRRFAVKPEDLLKNFTTWYRYDYNNVKLSQDFIALDVDSNVIKKEDFLHRLSTGKYFAIKTMSKDEQPYYNLYTFPNRNVEIEETIKQKAATAIAHYEMEGKELSPYHFTDVKGTTYSNNSTKGKVVVLKCWFIHCVACVKEFPVLNDLVDKYKDSHDIEFISLASDTKLQLNSFLRTREFKYAVVPGQREEYMREQLNVTEYPTHFLIDRTGKIVKVVNSIEDLIPFIEKEVKKNAL
ncbi:hypothetical protein SAE01_27460 [Segetibacter aerophilus]|uniref:Thioredoxin domain-containing protein n=2 Tax=Segetibacter aerophilus TaxID=670293 RepID=A0A512BE58_9BACT|nr:hypothetical protein SAE01_27460 [Segetibacter aerophilus]